MKLSKWSAFFCRSVRNRPKKWNMVAENRELMLNSFLRASSQAGAPNTNQHLILLSKCRFYPFSYCMCCWYYGRHSTPKVIWQKRKKYAMDEKSNLPCSKHSINPNRKSMQFCLGIDTQFFLSPPELGERSIWKKVGAQNRKSMIVLSKSVVAQRCCYYWFTKDNDFLFWAPTFFQIDSGGQKKKVCRFRCRIACSFDWWGL